MKKRLSLLSRIFIWVIPLVIAFMLLFTLSVQFKDKVITIYYKLAPEKTSFKSNVAFCEDDEGYVDYFFKGSVQLTYENNIIDLYADTCKDSVLQEYSCEFNKLKLEEYNCEAGCYDGECLVPTEDSSVDDLSLTQYCQTYRISSPLNAVAQSEFSFYSALNAIDGDLSTHWFGNPNSPYPKWIYFDFGWRVCISEIDLYAFKEDIPITGHIQASQDAIRWKTIMPNVTLTDVSLKELKLPNVITARYIRFYEISGNRSYGSLTDARFKIADLAQKFDKNPSTT